MNSFERLPRLHRIIEDINIPGIKDKYPPRHKMPQILSGQLDNFINSLEKQGIRITRNLMVPPTSLKPSQSEFNIERVKKIMAHDDRPIKIIIANDQHILDGHHTWLAKLNTSPDTKIPVTKINLNIKELVKAANDFSGVVYKSIHEVVKSIKNLIAEDITRNELHSIEKYCDTLFAQLGIDVAFSKHFFERVNDERNGKPITVDELITLFNKEFYKNGKIIASMKPDAEAVLKDMASRLNAPVVMKYDRTDGLQLVAKTIMRKANFYTHDRELRV